MLGTSKYLFFLRIQHLEPWGCKCHVSLMKQVTSPPGNTVLPCICRSQGEKMEGNKMNAMFGFLRCQLFMAKIRFLCFTSFCIEIGEKIFWLLIFKDVPLEWKRT